MLMDPSSIIILKTLVEDQSTNKELVTRMGLSKKRVNAMIKDLENQGYIDKAESIIRLKQNVKTLLFRKVASQYDIKKILEGNNEIIFYLLSEQKTVDDLINLSKLSLSTIQRILKELQSVGALKSEGELIGIDNSKESLYLFAKSLKTERERGIIEEYAEVVYSNSQRILKKVAKGKATEGELTAFSVFPSYGIDYVTTHDYYIRQNSDMTLADVLIDALLIASKNNDKNGVAVTILFYLKNRNSFDILDIRKVAKSCDIIDLWLDIESYLRNNQNPSNDKVKNKHLLLGRHEFEEKAQLYDIPSDLYTLPEAYPKLFEDIGRGISRKARAYLFGGENMRIKKLKDRTKDCDVVFPDGNSLRAFNNTLYDMDYKSLNRSRLSSEDRRVNPSDILIHDNRSRMDIFLRNIGNKLYLSNRIAERAEIQQFGKLQLGILQNEDVFLLKGVTDREGDIDDMAKLVQGGDFDWNIVWNELNRQEHETANPILSIAFLEQIDNLLEQTGIRPPFYSKLIRTVLDNHIEKSIRKGGIYLDNLLSLLKDKRDIPEKLVRNRVDDLERKKRLRKINTERGILLTPRKGNVLNIPAIDPPNFGEKLSEYIHSFAIRLNLPMKIERHAQDIAKNVSAEPKFIGFRPRNIAASIIYVTCRLHEVNVNGAQVSRIANVSLPSIYGRAKDIRELLRKKLAKS
jgi:predicted transcriptional regulator